MPSTEWTIRFDNYLPVDDRLEERLSRLVAELDRLPDEAITVDASTQVVTVDCARIPGWREAARGLVRTARVGRRLVVKPLWETYPAEAGDVVLEIDAEGVFGSGLHQTTALCLELLEEHVRPGSVCVDFGTGSGILAIAAARLGAACVVALDALPAAAAAARANVRSNGLDERVVVLVGSAPAHAGVEADLLAANVTESVLETHAPGLRTAIKRGGRLIASGFNEPQVPRVRELLSAAGFRIEHQVSKGQWVALVATAVG